MFIAFTKWMDDDGGSFISFCRSPAAAPLTTVVWDFELFSAFLLHRLVGQSYSLLQKWIQLALALVLDDTYISEKAQVMARKQRCCMQRHSKIEMEKKERSLSPRVVDHKSARTAWWTNLCLKVVMDSKKEHSICCFCGYGKRLHHIH